VGEILELRDRKGSQRWPNARIADWWQESNGRDDWFGRDGVHLTTVGARELANLVQRTIAADDAR
jgi:lysophospholipase L1-like esterase